MKEYKRFPKYSTIANAVSKNGNFEAKIKGIPFAVYNTGVVWYGKVGIATAKSTDPCVVIEAVETLAYLSIGEEIHAKIAGKLKSIKSKKKSK